MILTGMILLALQEATTPTLQPLDRGSVYLDLRETLDGDVTDVNYPRAVIYRYLAHHGFSRAKKRSRAQFVIRGTFACRYDKPLYFEYENAKVLIEHQFVGTANLEIQATARGTAAPIIVPAVEVRSGVRDRTAAAQGVRRQLSTAAARAAVLIGPLMEPGAAQILLSLEDPETSQSADEIVDLLVKTGSKAIPYCLDCFLENRPARLVRGPAQALPVEKKGLLTYHLADRVLARVFGKPRFFSQTLAQGRVEAFEHWMRQWQQVQPMPEQYRLPPEK